MEEKNANKLISGQLLKLIIGFFILKKGEQALNELEQKCGNIVVDTRVFYPVEKLNQITDEVVNAIYPNNLENGYYELGKYTLNSFINTLVGATLTAKYKTPRAVLENSQGVWQSLVNFGSRKLVKIEEEKGWGLLKIEDDPRNPTYLRGVIDACLIAIGKKEVHSELIESANNAYQMRFYWRI